MILGGRDKRRVATALDTITRIEVIVQRQKAEEEANPDPNPQLIDAYERWLLSSKAIRYALARP